MAKQAQASQVRVRAFWRAYRAGASVEEATAAVGVSVTAGKEWLIKAGGVCPDLAEPSGRYLSKPEREWIDEYWEDGLSKAEIARRLGRHRSTVGRELRRNAMAQRTPGQRPPGRPRAGQPRPRVRYRAERAQVKSEQRGRRPKPGKLAGCARLRAEVQTRLRRRWSPEQISRSLRRDFPQEPQMWVSHETIYQALYVQGRGQLRRELARCLRTGRALRKPRRRGDQRRSRIPNMVNISERPAEADDRAVPGHWEGDLIIGKNGTSAIGTLVERSTRFVMLLHLPTGNRAEQVRDAMITAMHGLPTALRRSLTWDQGIELARHREITIAADLPIFFCDPHSPWQRGSNENTNGLLRQYFPKGTELSAHSADHLAAVAAELNERPRKTLGWHSPAEALAQLLSTPGSADVATTP